MVRIDFYIFGYRRVKLTHDTLSYAVSILLRSRIPTVTDGGFTLLVKERDFQRSKELLAHLEPELSEPLGFFGIIKRYPHKLGLSAGLCVSLLLIILSSLLVWDVRIEGNSDVPESTVEEMLEECGFGVGRLWLLSDRSAIETELLKSTDRITWVNINKRGTVAYVKIIESEPDAHSAPESPVAYSNVVATADCVIEEITVTRGTAEVAVGDVVRRGDILISGLIPIDAGGGLCRAEGVVIGRIFETVTVDVSREHEKLTEKSRELKDLELEIFNFKINIFKKYGKVEDKCDIIEEINSYSLLGGPKFPFAIIKSYITEDSYEMRSYSDEELVRVASARLSSALAEKLLDSDLLKRKTYGAFNENGYSISSDIVYLTAVSEEKEIEICK